METISREILDKLYPKRPEGSRKYDFGYLLVIGGSEYYTGAPALSGLAAYGAGADMVRIVAPERAGDIIAGFTPILATTSLKGCRLCKEHLGALIEATAAIRAVSNGKCAVVVGGGIGRSQDTMDAVREFIAATEVATVVDADAVHALAQNPELLKQERMLFTPHVQEFYALTGNKVDGKTDEEKAEIVANQAKTLGITIALKGKTDIISDGDRVALGKTGNALMTKGGMGDTFAGIAGALLARGADLFNAACAAAYINGAAGELAAQRRGEAVTAMDLIDEIPNVLPKYEY